MDVKKITYFKEAGEQNTDALLKIVEEYVNKENITTIIIAARTRHCALNPLTPQDSSTCR
jgi:hypothetical protein